jgi:hypothetical protein
MELVREQRNEVKVYHETDPYLVIPNFYLKNKDYDNYYAFMNDILYIYQKLFNLKLFLTAIFKKSIVFSNKNIAFLFYVYNSMTTQRLLGV